MIPVERMGLARDFVKLTPTVGENPPKKTSKYERVRVQRNRISFRISIVCSPKGLKRLVWPCLKLIMRQLYDVPAAKDIWTGDVFAQVPRRLTDYLHYNIISEYGSKRDASVSRTRRLSSRLVAAILKWR